MTTKQEMIVAYLKRHGSIGIDAGMAMFGVHRYATKDRQRINVLFSHMVEQGVLVRFTRGVYGLAKGPE